MEIVKIILFGLLAVSLTYVVNVSIAEYHYNEGVRAVMDAADKICQGDDIARARMSVLYSTAYSPGLSKMRLLARLASAIAIGLCFGGYFVSLC